MDKYRTTMGVLLGIILGIVGRIGFKSIVVGFVMSACFAVLFVIIFNKVNRKDKF